MTGAADRLVDDYLRRLRAALAGLPRTQRDEILDEVAAHIATARATSGDDELNVRALLDRLGDPEQIAADAHERAPAAAPRRDWQETVAIVLLLVGGFLWGVGWLVGLVLLWLSSAWTLRDKLIGTLLVPGGLALPVLLATVAFGTSGGTGTICTSTGGLGGATGSETCTQTAHGVPAYERALWIALFVALVVAPILSAVYLSRRSRRAAVVL